MRFTHSFDALQKLLIICLSAAMTTALCDLIGPWFNRLSHVLVLPEWMQWVLAIAALAGVVFLYITSVSLLTSTVLPYWLPTWAWCRTKQGVSISVDDAQKVSFLFDGSTGGWLSSLKLRKFPRHERLMVLRQIANQVAAQRKQALPYPEPTQERREKSERAKDNRSGSPQIDPLTSVHLETLGLSSAPVNFDELKTAYRRKLRQYHPDLYAKERPEVARMAAEGTRRINDAFNYLKRTYGYT